MDFEVKLIGKISPSMSQCCQFILHRMERFQLFSSLYFSGHLSQIDFIDGENLVGNCCVLFGLSPRLSEKSVNVIYSSFKYLVFTWYVDVHPSLA